MIEEQLTSKEICTGCHSCFNICPNGSISMQYDSEGFLYPKVDNDNCIECRKCIDVCPTITNSFENLKNTMLKSYAAYSRDENIRLISSSGGIFSLLAEEVINKNGVVFGAAFNEDFKLKHMFFEDMNIILDKFTGSKYLQSEIDSTYKKVKQYLYDGRIVLFSGTPCQVGGLKSYLGKDHDNLICVDLICHGVPSPEVWNKYKEYRERESSSTTQRISFRHKKYGWKRYSVLFEFTNNTEYLNPLDKDIYMKAFLKDIALRPSCYNCHFKGFERYSDITLADFWGIENISNSFNDNLGTSLVIVNSSKGEIIFDALKGNLKYEEVDLEKALEFNKAATKSAEKNPLRDEFMSKLDCMEFKELVDIYCRDPFSYKIRSKIVNILIKTNTLNLAKRILKQR